ncbi:DNA-3-methyladenine glycosylase family protein [Fictibacillus barbaricus]|uniref:DNA-3-methyladenine glycosylase II n=1 Tax=Fictibacillus barbaricus TaxID=182136 RepID=A0ABU1TW47_9BACL|nr:DNA-3-methyladenine glycosylase [Fictibacillus barbaricus]MDR7071421.1 DNA-3-methyladenine glycosylase II [Fictibacillus barbaricus]
MLQTNQNSVLKIEAPSDFKFQECLVFLGRSDKEILHHIENDSLYKLIKLKDQHILLKISIEENTLIIEFPDEKPVNEDTEKISEYVTEYFDLKRDLSDFYKIASNDQVLKRTVAGHKGLRIIGIPDLFEALTWAIMGQQINLAFAYTIKSRFVEKYGEKLEYDGRTFWLYPSYEKIAALKEDDLRKLQFTTRKAEYVIHTAKLMAAGELSKENLLTLQDLDEQRDALIKLRGVGAWTADYVSMKCLLQPGAFPIADVGLHNAIKIQLGLDAKPGPEEIMNLAKNWSGWEAYATFYLWRSLYE